MVNRHEPGQWYDVHPESILGLLGKRADRFSDRACLGNFRVNVMFGVAGFRPGRRTTLVSAKVVKTIDAPSGLIEEEGR